MKAQYSQLLSEASLSSEAMEMLKSLLPASLPHEEELSRRLSLLRTFTSKTYALACLELGDPPPMDKFLERVEANPVHQEMGRWAMCEGARNEAISGYWTEHPDERRKWAKRFAQALDRGHEIERMDRLQLLFMGDLDFARSEFTAAYRAADDAGQLAAAAALVELVTLVIRQFGDEASKMLQQDCRARQRARSLFYTEFYQTVDYFPRSGMEQALEVFLKAPAEDPWIFHLYAAGGMGKTTFLRHLVAHNCVRRNEQIPCAWIDFDYLEISCVLQARWLLFLPIAAQWNEQLQVQVFGGVLNPSTEPFGALLFRTKTDGFARGFENAEIEQASRTQYMAGRSNPMRCGILANAVPVSGEARASLLADARSSLGVLQNKFAEALTSVPSDRPILLFLDTLELVSHSQGLQLLQILSMIRELRSEAQEIAKRLGRAPVNLKVILSGRYALGKEHLKEFQIDFRGQFRRKRLKGLGKSEATEFLKGILPEAPRGLIAAIVKKAKGIPFLLSLFADWVKADPSLDKTKVEETDDVSAAMLIERIIKRIPEQPLRWIVRYGIVPRVLSKDFLAEVMREPLCRALSGAAQGDSVSSKMEQDVWLPEPDFHFDAARLWENLVLPYVSKQGWLNPDGGRSTQVRFRSDILQAMRGILRKQAIFRELHAEAREWHAMQRRANPGDMASLVEVIYHTHQINIIDGVSDTMMPLLRHTFEDPAWQMRPDLRESIAEELFGEDFADFRDEEKSYIAFQRAIAMAESRNYRYLAPEPRAALEEAFGRLEKFQEDGVVPSYLPAYLGYWRVAARGNVSLSMLLSEMQRLPRQDSVVAVLILTELPNNRTPLVMDFLHRALSLYDSGPSPRVPIGMVHERIGQGLALKDPAQASEHFLAAAENFESRGDLVGCSRARRLASNAELTCGRLARAESILRPALQADIVSVEVILQKSRLELAKGEPGQALRQLGLLVSRQTTPGERLEVAFLNAEAVSQRILWKEADAAWQHATRLAERSRNINWLQRSRLGQTKLDRWWLQRVDLSPLDSRIYRTRNPSSYEVELCIWQTKDLVESPAARMVEDLLYQKNEPRDRLRLILALSQIRPVSVELWTDASKAMKALPRSARVMSLVEPVLLGNPPEIPPELRERFVHMAEYHPESDEERAWYGVRFAEWLGWLGFPERAAQVLHDFVTQAPSSATGWQAATFRERCRIEARLRRWKPGVVPYTPLPADYWFKIWPDTLFRAAAASLTNVGCAMDAGHFDLAEETLELVDPVLAECPIRTAFHENAASLRAALSRRQPTGRDTSVELVRGEAAQPPWPEPNEPRLPCRLLGMEPRNGRIVVTLSERQPVETVVSAVSTSMEIVMRSSSIPRRLTGISIEELAADLRDTLDEAGVPLSGAERMGIQASPGALCTVPWELAFSNASQMPWRGPSTTVSQSAGGFEAMLRQEMGRVGPPPNQRPRSGNMRNVILQPMSSQDAESVGSEQYWRLRQHSEAIYSVEEYGRYKADENAVLHVAGSYSETADYSEPILTGTELSPSYFARFLGGINRRPAVFLDVPPSRNPSEHMHQLLLRNYYAQALLDSGMVHCVFATGLMAPRVTDEFHQILLNAAQNPSMRQIDLLDSLVALSRGQDSPSVHALFTRNPDASLEAGYA